MKKLKTYYRIATIFFALLMIPDAIGGISRQEAGVEAMGRLGYPVYILSIVGFSKLAGAPAILQQCFKVIKEWAFAGFILKPIRFEYKFFEKTSFTIKIMLC